MSTLRDQLWPVFVEEVNEQIDGLEALLAPTDSAGAAVDIHVLFRHFHTIKSNGSMMDFQSMEQIAHGCEDLLFVLREKSYPLEQGSRNLLIRAVDLLKQQLQYVSQFRSNPPVDENHRCLIDELDRTTHIIENDKSHRSGKPVNVEGESTLNTDEQTSVDVDSGMMRVNSRTLDDLVSSVGNISMRQSMLSHALQHRSVDDMGKQLATVFNRIGANEAAQADYQQVRDWLTLIAESHHLAIQAEQSVQVALAQIDQDILDLRVVPIAAVFNRLPVLVKKTAENSAKQVELIVSGADVRIDKRMVDTLMEPLVHIIRNAIDHGIETAEDRKKSGKSVHGTVTVRAEQDAGMLLLEVSDDGRGLDTHRIEQKARATGLVTTDHVFSSQEQIHQLIFLPGFSTAEKVTETSGRGVGMDVVKSKIASLGGQVEVHSRSGSGTCFKLQLPLSVAIQTVLLVKSASEVYAIALRTVSEIIPSDVSRLYSACEQSVCLFRGDVLPVVRLTDLMGIETSKNDHQTPRGEIVIIRCRDEWLGLMVDHVIGQQELIVREVHEDLSALPGLAGVSLLADGKVVIVIDVEYLISLSASSAHVIRRQNSDISSAQGHVV